MGRQAARPDNQQKQPGHNIFVVVFAIIQYNVLTHTARIYTMATRVPLTHDTINDTCIYISSEHTLLCHVYAFSMSNFKLMEAFDELKAYARANKIQMSGIVRTKAEIEALQLTLPQAIAERQALFNELAVGWKNKLATGLYYGFVVNDDEYIALKETLHRFSKTTQGNTVLGQAIELMSKLSDGLNVKPGSRIIL
jgi:hypothetical protein